MTRADVAARVRVQRDVAYAVAIAFGAQKARAVADFEQLDESSVGATPKLEAIAAKLPAENADTAAARSVPDVLVLVVKVNVSAGSDRISA